MLLLSSRYRKVWLVSGTAFSAAAVAYLALSHRDIPVRPVIEPAKPPLRLPQASPAVSQDEPSSTEADSKAVDTIAKHSNVELAKAQYEVTESGELSVPYDKPMKFTKLFQFPDGETIEIAYSVEHPFGEPLPITSAVQFSNDLQAVRDLALSGDPRAAMTAYETIKNCLETPEYFPARRAGGLCANLDEVSLAEARSQVKAAADSGSDAAQMMLSQENMTQNPELAREYFSSLWDKGFVIALNGLVATWPDTGNMTYEEQISREAFAFADYAIFYAYLDGIPVATFEEHMKHIAAQQEQRLLSLAPAVHEKVLDRTKSLLQANTHCCRAFIDLSP